MRFNGNIVGLTPASTAGDPNKMRAKRASAKSPDSSKRSLDDTGKIPAPVLRFGGGLEFPVSRLQESPHVPGQKEAFGKPAEEPKWRSILENIAHSGSTVGALKDVIVSQ